MLVKRHEKVDKKRLKFRDQARKIDPTSIDIQQLADSLEQYGQLEEIGVVPDYTVIWGNRRAMAALQRPGIQFVNAVVLEQELSESEFRVLQGIENFQQKPLRLHEQSLVVAELLRLNAGWTYQDVSKALSIDASMAGKLMLPFGASEPVRAAYFAGRLNSTVFTIANLPLDQQAEPLALALAGNPRRDIEALARQVRGGQTATKPSNPTPPPKATPKPRVVTKKCLLHIPIGRATVSVRGPKSATLVDVASLLKTVSDAAVKAATEGATLDGWLAKLTDPAWLATLPAVTV